MNSTNFATTPCLRNACVNVSTISVVVTPAFARPSQTATDDGGNRERQRLAKHRRQRFNRTDAPTKYAEAVRHRRVTIHTDHCVRTRNRRSVGRVQRRYDGSKHFEINLVQNAVTGRDDAKTLECILRPAHERIAFAVAAKFECKILIDGIRNAGNIDDRRVIDDQVDRNARIDVARLSTQIAHRRTHGREIGSERDARGITGKDAHGMKWDLRAAFSFFTPARERIKMLARDDASVRMSQQVLEKYLQRIGQVAPSPAYRCSSAAGRLK